MIVIQSKRDGFRRCGIAHSKEPVEYPDGHFNSEKLSVLKNEPMLTVEIKEGEPAGVKKGLNAKDTIKLVKEAGDLQSLDVLAEGEERKSVLEAIAARREELEKAASESGQQDPQAGGDADGSGTQTGEGEGQED